MEWSKIKIGSKFSKREKKGSQKEEREIKFRKGKREVKSGKEVGGEKVESRK